MAELSDQFILILGVAVDAEFNELLMELEVLMVNSIYKLDLSRPKKSYFAQRWRNKEIKRVEKFLLEKSLIGQHLPKLVILAMHMVEEIKEIEFTEQQVQEYFSQYSDKAAETLGIP